MHLVQRPKLLGKTPVLASEHTLKLKEKDSLDKSSGFVGIQVLT